MDVVPVLGKGAKLYFWLLVTAGVGIAVYLGVRAVAGAVGDTIGWAAFVGIVAVLVVLLEGDPDGHAPDHAGYLTAPAAAPKPLWPASAKAGA